MIAPSCTRERSTHRRGSAIVAALGLVLLAAALLASATQVATAAAKRARAERDALIAESGARRALATVILEWTHAYDALGIGQSVEVAPTRGTPDSAPIPLATIVRVARLDTVLFAITVDARAGIAPATARRRIRLLVRRLAADSAVGPGIVRPITRWSTTDLF